MTVKGKSADKILSVFICTGKKSLSHILMKTVPDFSCMKLKRSLTLQFPLPEFIMAMGFFLVLILEQILLSFSHHQPIQSPESHPHDHHHHRGNASEEPGHLHVDFTSQSALRAFILVFSLSLHSIFEGLAVGLVEDEKEVMEICLALVIHKSIIALSLCFRLLQGRIRRTVAAGCLLLFSVMSPLGIAIGVGLTEETRSSPKQQIVRCSLEGLAGGTFFYITFMEILPHELQGNRNNMPKVCMLLLGFALVTAVLFIRL
uniref:Solute carrier family 39 member 1 n=1 Tax=Neogobius melanostomus TaxID=47308 RepID=A0A8C6WML5_9GOBI